MKHAAVVLKLLGLVAAQRSATVHEVQPLVRDRVHALWLNGPTFSGKVSGGTWPNFQANAPTRSGTMCAALGDARYSGYDENGNYCEAASTVLDDDAHLLLHSGRLGVVVDVGGLKAQASSHTRNLLPRLGATSGTAATPREVYDALDATSTNITLEVACGSETSSYVLGTAGGDFVQIGLVRQGHTVTQVTLTGLQFQGMVSGNIYGPCESFVAEQQSGRRLAHHTNNGRCNQNFGGASHACPADFPECVGFVQGQGWGQCWSTCTAGGHPNLWGELSIWGDSMAFELAWDADFDLGANCTGAITVEIGAHSSTTTLPSGGARRLDQLQTNSVTADATETNVLNDDSGPVHSDGGTPIATVPGDELDHELHFPRLPVEAGNMSRRRQLTAVIGGRISLVLTATSDSSLVTAQASSHPVEVTSEAGQVLSRAATHDVFIEVPTNTPKCSYNMACAKLPLKLVDMIATNPHPTELQTMRLSFSRNFETRDAGLSQSSTGAEITGLSMQIWETSSLQPTGLAVQISKNWHTGSTDAYWAGFDGYWWTASVLLRLPPNSSIALSLALSYEKYGGVPAWSHAQLSIVGYSDKWLWEQAALGTGGENICFDPLGTHTRAFITDMRPKLFDGEWKENIGALRAQTSLFLSCYCYTHPNYTIGGGDFVQMFGLNGKLQYWKELDPQLHVSGPCLSKADYTAVTLDGAVSSHVTIRGSRTDDMVILNLNLNPHPHPNRKPNLNLTYKLTQQVRVFVDVRLEAIRDTTFSRLVFFQLGSETYSYRATHERFAWGGNGAATTYLPRNCSPTGGGRQLRSDGSLYAAEGTDLPFRAALSGSAPWWFAFEENTDATSIDTNSMVVGDRGFVVRNFSARLGGVQRASPSFSVLCDKIELGTPSGLLSLTAADYMHISLELLVLPRAGKEYDTALRNTESQTLRDSLYGLSTSERVRAQAVGGELRVVALRNARVDGHYPVRVFATVGSNAIFEVQSQDATELASGMVDWCVGNRKQGRYCCAAACGEACGNESTCGAQGEAMSCCTSTLSAPCLADSQHSCIDPSHFESVHMAPLGFVPIVISGLASHAVPSGQGLWIRAQGASAFTLLSQGSGNEFWQINFDRDSGTYEIVYNVELRNASTTVAFGSDPDTWEPLPPLPPPPLPPTAPFAPPPSTLPTSQWVLIGGAVGGAAAALLLCAGCFCAWRSHEECRASNRVGHYEAQKGGTVPTE